jgi:PPM family protein phosphatase
MSFKQAPLPSLELRYAARTDVGLARSNNEDSYLVADLGEPQAREARDGEIAVGARGALLLVCDGMGGAAAGEVASGLATITAHRVLCLGEGERPRHELASSVYAALESAGEAIWLAAERSPQSRGMGTTATLAALVDDHLFLGQVGDSRGYLLREGKLTQLTRDQTLVQQMLDTGQITPEEAETFEHSNIILQALGTARSLLVDLRVVKLCRGDVLLVCSDGLSGLISDAAIAATLTSAGEPGQACDRLIEQALDAGGHDNVTCIVARFGGDDLPEPDGAPAATWQYSPPEAPPSASGEPAPDAAPPDDAPGSGAVTGRRSGRPASAAAAPTPPVAEEEVLGPPMTPTPAWLYALLLFAAATLLLTCIGQLRG